MSRTVPQTVDSTQPSRTRNVIVSLLLLTLIIGVGAVMWPATLGGKMSWVVVSGDSMLPAYETNDLVVAWDDGDWQLGDVVIYRVAGATQGLVVHRLVDGDAQEGWIAQGDNRPRVDPWVIPDDAIQGREVLHIPGVGVALSWVRSPQILAVLSGLLVFWAFMVGPRQIKRMLTRVPVREPVVVAGSAGVSVDLHAQGGRFALPPDCALQVGDEVPFEIWLSSVEPVRVARGTLDIRHRNEMDAEVHVGGPITWNSDEDRAAVEQHCQEHPSA